MHSGFRARHDEPPSGQGARVRNGRATRTLARGVLLLVSGFSLASCLVDEPPEFQDPERTAPILYLDKSEPRNTTFLPATSNATIPFSIVLQSNDLGDNVVAYPWLNFGLVGELALTPQRIAPGIFEEPRSASFLVMIPSGQQGCVALTILFFHEDDSDTFHPGRPVTGAPVSRATWWLLVDADPEDVTIADCPRLPNELPPQQ